jgi:hypothetical protein
MRAWIVVAALLPAVADAQPRWWKGNTHTHTLNTDGDSSPVDVARFYREQGYHFLVLSDHDSLTSVEALNGLFGTSEGPAGADAIVRFNPFLLIPGEEVTASFSPKDPAVGARERDPGRKAVHLTALDVRRAIAPQRGVSVADTLQKNVDAVRAAGATPIVNHPNFLWSLTAPDIAGLRNVSLLELFNGHMQTNNLGGGGAPSVEEIWDAVLSAGTPIYGVASDDAHSFKTSPLPAVVAAPGRGWVMVRSERLTADAIVAALERGDFYASTGVELVDVAVSERALTLTLAARSRSRYRVLFIGHGGRVLKEVAVADADAPQAVSYEWQGDEGYVRAKVIESNGYLAWTQPVRVPRSNPGK